MKKITRSVWILGAIILVGIFLRTYHFHDWLHFGSDQSRDAMVSQHVLSSESSWPSLGPEAANTGFYLGPIYYYFQIVSAKIFGTDPQVFAYPDLLFSVLSIALLYFFLKKYFSSSLSLALASVYAVSFYAIEYSRFAWNTNPIPFFALLFIFALSELLTDREKASWWWVVFLGISVGVGVQLHTVLLFLFPAMLFFSAIFSMKNGWRIWNRWAVVFAIILILNLGQISYEMKTDYANVKTFFLVSADKSHSGKNRFWNNLEVATLCHAQANTVMVSAMGDNNKCSYDTIINSSKKIIKNVGHAGYGLYLVGIAASLIFSITGYGLLASLFYREKDRRKKYFLGIILLYVSLSFILLISVLRDAPLRYFIHTVFVPFLFVGFIFEVAEKKMKKKSIYVVAAVSLFLIVANLSVVNAEAVKLANDTRGDSGYVVLGEIEPMVDFMTSLSPRNQAYLFGRNTYFTTYASSLSYVAAMQGYTLIRGKRIEDVPAGAPVFYIWKNSDSNVENEFNGREVEQSKMIGNLGIYKLKN